jgi:hypothetical protein
VSGAVPLRSSGSASGHSTCWLIPQLRPNSIRQPGILVLILPVLPILAPPRSYDYLTTEQVSA